MIGYIYDLVNDVNMTESTVYKTRPAAKRSQHFTFEYPQHTYRTKDFSDVLEPLKTCGKQTANFKFL